MASEAPDPKGVKRGSFLAGIATAGAATAASAAAPKTAEAATTVGPPVKMGPPSPIILAADTETPVVVSDKYHVRSPGSDYMVDVVKSTGIEFIAATPGSTFRGIQESFVNYGRNTQPEWITVVHEEISAAVAHGYAKVAGKPMALIVHNTVGLQHASMAMYNAWCDRIPMLVLVGNIADAATRRPGVEWYHTATDVAQMVRGFIKYDDQPVSLDHFRESTQRAYTLMNTPPMGSALIIVDADLAEDPIRERPAAIAKLHPVSPPVGDPNAVEEAGKWLAAAQRPVIVAGRTARTAQGMHDLVRLAELLQAPVIDTASRMNFPTNHYLNQTFRGKSLIGNTDLVLNLENDNLFGVVEDVPDYTERRTVRKIKPGTKVVDINSELIVGGGNYQDKQRFYPADLSIAGDAEATLPMLIASVERNMTTARRNANAQRAQQFKEMFISRRMADRDQAAVGWDAQPISVARMVMETWNQVRHENWALVSQTTFLSSWPQRLWDITETYQYIGHAGGAGVGYQMPSAVGAALAHKAAGGRFAVNIVGDGDFMMLPGSLWTLAHHRIPLLTIVHNNRAWQQELMHVTRIADRRDRNPAGGRIGTTITDPNIDYAKLAQAQGVYAEGPIEHPSQLAPAIARAVKVVKSGHPALIDVHTQGR